MTDPAPDPGRRPSAMVSRPAEVLRVAMATREVLEELRTDDLTDAARRRANAIYDRSVEQLGTVLSDDLRRELADLVPRREGEEVPSTAELRVADAQLSGWLDGLLQSMQALAVAQAQEAHQQRAEASARAAEKADEARRHGRDTTYL